MKIIWRYTDLKAFFPLAGVILFIGIYLVSCKKEKSEPLYAVFTIPNSNIITSLNELNNDTLLIGTDRGEIYVYCPIYHETPIDTINVGKRAVYEAFPFQESLFVGVSDEGLKQYTKAGKGTQRYRLGSKGYEYAVYQVLCCGDTLLCATSCGLALLDLTDPELDSLQLIYPETRPTLHDCKFNSIWWSHDNKLEALYNDSILTFDRGCYNKPVSKTNPPKENPWEDTLTQSKITYKFKQGDNKFYAFSHESIVPHNVLLVRRLGKSDSVIAVTEDWSSTKNVYIGNKDGVIWNRAWSQCLSRDVPGQITDAVFFSGGSCIILTATEKIYAGNQRHLTPLNFNSNPDTMPDRAKCIYYCENLKKLFVALGSDYVTYPLNDEGIPIWNEERFYDDNIPIRCFAEKDGTIYMGTIHDSCIIKDKRNFISKLPYNDIRDIKFQSGTRFILTVDSLIIDDNIKVGHENVSRLYTEADVVFGISAGHFYSFDKEKNFHPEILPFNPTFGHVNPHAVVDQSGFPLFIGTDKGLFFALDSKINNLKNVPMSEPHNLWSIILSCLAAVAILTGLLVLHSKKKNKNQKKEDNNDPNNQLNHEETDTKNTIETIQVLRNTLQNQILEHPYLKIAITNIPSQEHCPTDWVVLNATQYNGKCEEFKRKVQETDFSDSNSFKELQEEINEKMLRYAFAAELYNFRQSWNNLDINIRYQKISDLNQIYMKEIVSFTSVNINSNKKDYFLHLWTIALLSNGDDKKKLIINDNKFLSEYVKLSEYYRQNQPKNTDNPTHLKYSLREDLSKLFKVHDQKMSDLYKEIKNDLMEKIQSKRGNTEQTK